MGTRYSITSAPVPLEVPTREERLRAAGTWNALVEQLASLEAERQRKDKLLSSQLASPMTAALGGEWATRYSLKEIARLDAEEQRIRDEMRALETAFPDMATYAPRQTIDAVELLARQVMEDPNMPVAEKKRQLEQLYEQRSYIGSALAEGSQEAYEAPASVAETESTASLGIYDPSYVSPQDQWQMQFSEQEAERQWRQTQFEQQLQREQWAWQQRQAQQQYQLSQQQMGAGMMPSLLGLQQEAWNARRQYELPQGTQYLPTFEPGGLMSSLAQSGGWGFTPREPLNLPIPGQGVGPAMRWAQGMMGY